MTFSVRRCAIGAATSAAMVLASAAPALAATHHHSSAGHKPAAAVRFNVHGIVVAVHGNQVKVLSSVAKVGKHIARNKVVTLTLTPRTKRTARARIRPGASHAALMARGSTAAAPTSTAPMLAAGTDIVATGTVSGNGTLVTTSETSTVLPAEALVGMITSVNPDGSFVVATHDQVDGDHAEHDNNDGVLVAALGAPVTGPAVAAGEYVVVLGEAEHHTMAAAKIYTFTTAPTLAAGQVTTADSTAKTLTVDAQGSEHDGQEEHDNEDGSNPSIAVDASNADIVINGATPAVASPAGTTTPPAAFPAVGDQVLTVGMPGATPDSITASLVFDFNQADNGSVQDNQDNEDAGHNNQD